MENYEFLIFGGAVVVMAVVFFKVIVPMKREGNYIFKLGDKVIKKSGKYKDE